MAAVMISIHPKWCGLIASGQKTIEVRKTRPKLDTPFKCYIYKTMTGYVSRSKENDILVPVTYGKVIGEFVCDEIIKNDIDVDGDCLWGEAQDCLTDDEFEAYIKNVNVIYGWHISALKIYDKPRELGEFWAERVCTRGMERDGCIGCWDCKKKPPQSWCYVEELK